MSFDRLATIRDLCRANPEYSSVDFMLLSLMGAPRSGPEGRGAVGRERRPGLRLGKGSDQSRRYLSIVRVFGTFGSPRRWRS